MDPRAGAYPRWEAVFPGGQAIREPVTRGGHVTQGLILLGFLGVLVAFGWLRLRRRMGLGISGKIFMTVLTGFVLIVLTMWAAQHG